MCKYKKRTQSDSRDCDTQELFAELTAVSRRRFAKNKPLDAFKFICDNGMESVFSEACIAIGLLRI